MNELISIVVPLYNVEDYLHKCIDSILSQVYERIEVVLVNDGSTDNSGKICDEYAKKDERVKVIHKPNSGVSDTRNICIKHASGEYLILLDSDDWIEDNSISDIVKIINNNPVDVVLGQFKCCPEPNAVIINDIPLKADKINGKSRDDVLEYLQNEKGFIYVVWRYVINRSFLVNNNLFFLSSLLMVDDEEWTPRLLCASNSFYLYEKQFYSYRTRASGSIISRRGLEKVYSLLVATISLYEQSSNDKFNNVQKLFFLRRAEFLFSTAIREIHLSGKDRIKQVKTFIKNSPLLIRFISKSKLKVCILINMLGLDKGIRWHRFLFYMKNRLRRP